MRHAVSTSKQGGFSILELLISLLLGLIVVAGIVQLFVGNSRTYELVTAQSRLQENARYSFEFITEAARDAGYFGCAPEPDFVIKSLIGNWNTIPEYDLSQPIGGFEAVGDGTYTPNDLLTLPRSEGGVNTNVHIADTGVDRNELDPTSDIVIFRGLEQPVARLNQVLQPDGDPELYTPGGEPSFAANDVVVLSDCEQAAMFRVTAVLGGVNTTTLSHATNAAGNNFDNGVNITTLSGEVLPATLSVLGRSYGRAATVGRVETTIFFIAPSTSANNAGDNVNSLWRKQGPNAPIELVQGVENMQVFYGVDTTADGVASVTRYQTMDAVADPTSIVAVRIRLDIASPEELAEVGDRLRRTFSKTISIRNMGV